MAVVPALFEPSIYDQTKTLGPLSKILEKTGSTTSRNMDLRSDP
jgi:hypothetical protein